MKTSLFIALFLLGFTHSLAMAGIAQVKMTPEAAKVGEEVKFLITAEGATQSCGFRIEFGDGDAADVKVGTDENNNAFPKTVAKTYSRPGSYYVTAAGKLVGSFDLFKLSTPYLPCMGEARVTVKVEEVAVAKPAPAPAAAPVPASKCPDGFEVHMGAANDGSFSCAPKKCPDGMKVKGEVAKDGSFSCMPIGAAASEPPASNPVPEDNAQKRTAETMVALGADHDFGKAKAGYAKALELDPDYAPARYGLGLMLEAEEDWNGARQAFQQVIDNPRSGSFSGAAKAELADIEKTTTALKTPEGRKRLEYDDLVAQARSFLRSRQIPEAAKEAIAAQKLDESRWEAYLVAGEAAQAAGLMPQAVHLYETAAKRAPSPYKEKLAKVAGELGGNSKAAAGGTSATTTASHFPEATSDAHSLRNVDFHRGEKSSDGYIQVDLSDAGVGIDIRQQGKSLIVDFKNTNLPRNLQRKLDVTDFQTPVEGIDTFIKGDTVRMVIESKGLWEQVAYKMDNKFIVKIKPAK